ncbi:MAG: EthD family reductase [Ardenticatenaceae bacterium]|nr:EthD family reductase [Ardenticatenaceae bacterium]MCB9443674.1 EthD family reductase [Ardenticatenaceae bacterium]
MLPATRHLPARSMYKFTTLYRKVDDLDAVDNFFSSTHLPLAELLPGLLKSEVSRIMGQPAGESRFYLGYELYFESRKAFEDAMKSRPGVHLMINLTPWAEKRLVTWFYAESFEEAVGENGRDEEE